MKQARADTQFPGPAPHLFRTITNINPVRAAAASPGEANAAVTCASALEEAEQGARLLSPRETAETLVAVAAEEAAVAVAARKFRIARAVAVTVEAAAALLVAGAL